MCVRFSRAFIAACTASATLAFLSSRDEFASATFPPLGAYPARMYAAVAFKSIRYSATKRCCFCVRFIGLAPIWLLESALHRLAALATISGRCLDQLPFGVMQSGGRLPVTHPARCGVVLWPYGDGLRISPTKFRAPGMWYAYMPEAATLSASLCTPRGCRPWRGGEPVARDAKKPARRRALEFWADFQEGMKWPFTRHGLRCQVYRPRRSSAGRITYRRVASLLRSWRQNSPISKQSRSTITIR